MESIFDEIGIPKKYLKETIREDRFITLVHKTWLKTLVKHSKVIEFIEKTKFESWPTSYEEIGHSWIKIFIFVLKKRDAKVIPLPRIRPVTKEDTPLMFSQLMQYICQTNYRNLWKDSYKKYLQNSDSNKETQITLADYNDVLKEIISRLYGCPIINICESDEISETSSNFDAHSNILPSICAVETLNAIFLIQIPHMEHNLNDCVTFSPAILDKCYTKPLFIIYQLLNVLKSLHDKSLTLGDITLNDIYLTEDLWVYIFPQISSNIYLQEMRQMQCSKLTLQDCNKVGHHFSNMKCEYCGLKTYDKLLVTNENLEQLCKLWIEGQISNFTYISVLNKLSGRKLGDPNCHYVFPWVTDFASRCGKNWRDLKKSKYRLNKGDRQLDLTYDHSQTQVPHHVSDVLSSITYYVYMARRTPKSVLCKNVRKIWIPAEYPSSIQRMQEWTPDECIPEFFTDPAVFRSIHNDLDDLDVPTWASGPEDFIERHREALESQHVSERLHYWIDLTFGYKLSGNAAIKSKNVCLHLADDHTNLMKSGIVQLFKHPHPAKSTPSLFFSKIPPKVYVNKSTRQKTRDRSNSSQPDLGKSDEDDTVPSTSSTRSSLALSKILSRSRSSLNEEQGSKQSRSPSNQRSASLGPKNPSFTSHVSQKRPNQLSVPSSNLSTGAVFLPKEYKPEVALEYLEKKHGFISKTFHLESSETLKGFSERQKVKAKEEPVQNAFTNFIYADSFEERSVLKATTKKSHTFPLDNFNNLPSISHKRTFSNQRSLDHIVCNYSDIISSRRIKELQVLGCLIVEIFMAKHLRALGVNNPNRTFTSRLKSCLTILNSCEHEIPPCISYIAKLLLQPKITEYKEFRYPVVTDFGLPSPSAHLLLEPLLNCTIPFPKQFQGLYKIISCLKEFKSVTLELEILYHFECNGEMCSEYESLERTKILFAQNIAECKVKQCVNHLEQFLGEININTDIEIINILLPHIKELLDDPPTSVLAAWYLFDSIGKVLGPRNTSTYLLQSLLKLYENEPNEANLPYNGKIAKLYHHSFLLRIMVRLGLKCFLDNFVTPLVEAVGGYKDQDKIDFIFHTHSEKVTKKTSHLKTMDTEEISMSDDSSVSSEKREERPVTLERASKEEEVFDFEEDGEEEDQMKSIIEHLELNVASDLPFNHSSAEEALDASLTENIEHLRNLEELNINISQDADDAIENSSGLTSPTIPIPSSSKKNVMNISCEIGSKKSESDSLFERKSITSQEFVTASPGSSTDQTKIYSSSSSSVSNLQRLASKSKKFDTKISEVSADSLMWLSHRLGPVLMARYLSRNLLKMLTLCYVGFENLSVFLERDDPYEISITSSKVLGDKNAARVLECLTSIAALYGEKLILSQYIPHMTELIALCKKKLTPNLEGGLISCLALLKHIIPYLSDATLMDQLQDNILRNIVHPIVRLLGSTKYVFPSGYVARNVLARKYIDTLYIMSIRMGSDMTRKYLAVPALQRFFLIFNKLQVDGAEEVLDSKVSPEKEDFQKSFEESHYIEVRRDGTTSEWAIGGRPVRISHVRLKDSESIDSISPTTYTQYSTAPSEESVVKLALEQLKAVFNSELAHISYLPFLKHIGACSLEISLKNNENIRALCQEYEQEFKISYPHDTPKLKLSDFNKTQNITGSSSIGSNINLVGNRIEVQSEGADDSKIDMLTLVSNRMENNNRHLSGNWFAYWEHEIGRSDKDNTFNFKQIKLQTFTGHANSVKCLYVLDNENSFISGSRDKTIKLWSLRSQGDGSSVSGCQFTYTAHKKSILSLTFIESMRLVASCDSAVHIWDPYMGVTRGNLESPKFQPVNVLKAMPAPSSLIFAATTEGSIKVIDARLMNYIYELKVSVSPSGLIRCLTVSPNGLWIAAGQSSGCITVLDVRTGLVVSSWRAHESEVLQLVAFDNETIISSSLDQAISVWNVADGKFKFNLRGATEPVHCLQMYNNELISGTTANRIGVHTSISHEASFSSTKLKSDAFKGLLTSMAILPLNRMLLLGADTGNITLLC